MADVLLLQEKALRESLARLLHGTGLAIQDLYEDMKRQNPTFEQDVLPGLLTDDPPINGVDLKPALKSLVSIALANGSSDALRIEGLKVAAQRHPIHWRMVQRGMAENYLNQYSEDRVWEQYLKHTEVEFRDLVWALESPPLMRGIEEIEQLLEANNRPRPRQFFEWWLEGRSAPSRWRNLEQEMLLSSVVSKTLHLCLQNTKEWIHQADVNFKPALVCMYEVSLQQTNLLQGLLQQAGCSKAEFFRACAIETERSVKEISFADELLNSRSKALTEREMRTIGGQLQPNPGPVALAQPSVGEQIFTSFMTTLLDGVVSEYKEPETVIDAEVRLRKRKRERKNLVREMERKEEEARGKWFGRTDYDHDHARLIGFGLRTRGDYRKRKAELDKEIIELEGLIRRLQQQDSREIDESFGIPAEAAGASRGDLSRVKDKQDILEDIFGSGRQARRSSHERQYWKNKAMTAQYRKQAQAFEHPSKPEPSPGEKKKANKERVLKELEALIREKDEQVQKAPDEETGRRMANIYDDKIRDKTEELRKYL